MKCSAAGIARYRYAPSGLRSRDPVGRTKRSGVRQGAARYRYSPSGLRSWGRNTLTRKIKELGMGDEEE